MVVGLRVWSGEEEEEEWFDPLEENREEIFAVVAVVVK